MLFHAGFEVSGMVAIPPSPTLKTLESLRPRPKHIVLPIFEFNRRVEPATCISVVHGLVVRL